MTEPRRLGIVGCAVFTRELCALVADSPCESALRLLPKGLHNLPARDMCPRIQAVVDEVEATEAVDGVVLAYGLCNRGLEGICTRRAPLAILRAHDCIGVLLGSVRRHRAELESEPGTYFLSPGWVEHTTNGQDLRQASIEHRLGMDATYEELVAKYGEDNADFIWERLQQAKGYARCAWVSTGVVDEQLFLARAQARAAGKGWRFEILDGDPSGLRALIHGRWDDPRVLVLEPGQAIRATADDQVMEAHATPAR